MLSVKNARRFYLSAEHVCDCKQIDLRAGEGECGGIVVKVGNRDLSKRNRIRA